MFSNLLGDLLTWTLNSIMLMLSWMYIPIDYLLVTPLVSFVKAFLNFFVLNQRDYFWYEFLSSDRAVIISDSLITVLSLIFAI